VYNYLIVALIAKGGIMAFNLVYLSQQDPQWKNDILGFATDPKETIGYVGCALTSVSMLLSGYGFSETPHSLNQKLKDKQGFVGSGIRWDVVSQVHSQVKLQANIRCEMSDAPLGQIDAALNVGQPVIVRVDASPNPGLQWHYVLVYARQGEDYLMLDPWPYRPGTDKPDLLMQRYSQGQPLKRAIQQVLIYSAIMSGGPIITPSSPTTTTTPPSQPEPVPAAIGGVYARVMDSVTWGLNIRSSKDSSSKTNILISVLPGTQLLLLDPTEITKIGQSGQWVNVREPGGQEGFAAAQYIEKVQAAVPLPAPQPAPTPASDVSTSTPSPSTPIPSAPVPSTDSNKLALVVLDAVGTAGLRLRKTPSLGGALIMVLAAGTQLTVLEPPGKAKAKLGKPNQWIQVSEPGGNKGYVGAAYVSVA
jgi:hypothetical protein